MEDGAVIEASVPDEAYAHADWHTEVKRAELMKRNEYTLGFRQRYAYAYEHSTSIAYFNVGHTLRCFCMIRDTNDQDRPARLRATTQ